MRARTTQDIKKLCSLHFSYTEVFTCRLQWLKGIPVLGPWVTRVKWVAGSGPVSWVDDHNSWPVLVWAQRGHPLLGQWGACLFLVLFCSPEPCSTHGSTGSPLCMWLEGVGTVVRRMDWICTCPHCGFQRQLDCGKRPGGPTVIHQGCCPVRNKWAYDLLGSWSLVLRELRERRGEDEVRKCGHWALHMTFHVPLHLSALNT